MVKVSVELPNQLFEDLQSHIGSDKKCTTLSELIRHACRMALDNFDAVDEYRGRKEKK